MQITFDKKIKTTDNKIEANSGHYNLDREAPKSLTLLLGKVGKYELLTGKHLLTQNRLLKNSWKNEATWVFFGRYWFRKRN